MHEPQESYTMVFDRPLPGWAEVAALAYVFGPLVLTILALLPDRPALYPFQATVTRGVSVMAGFMDRLAFGLLPGGTIVVLTLAGVYVFGLLLGKRAACRRWGLCRVTPWGLDFVPPFQQSRVISVRPGEIVSHRETDAGFELDVEGRGRFATTVVPLLIPLAGDEERRAAQTLLDAFQDRSPPSQPEGPSEA